MFTFVLALGIPMQRETPEVQYIRGTRPRGPACRRRRRPGHPRLSARAHFSLDTANDS